MVQQQEQTLRPTTVVAARMRELRRRRGWSAEKLAEEMRNVGVQWQRVVVTKLENGKRDAVSVEEMLALAFVLDVAPVHLLVPPDAADDDRYRVTPQGDRTALQPSTVRRWIRGTLPISTRTPGGAIDGRRYFFEAPWNEASGDPG